MGLYSGGAYIWNEVSVSTCGGLIHGEAYIRGAYSRRFTVAALVLDNIQYSVKYCKAPFFLDRVSFCMQSANFEASIFMTRF